MVQKEIKNNISGQLQAILSANVESLRIWMEDIKRDTEVLASQPEIREKIISLIAMARHKDVAANVLKQTRDFKWLRENLGNACKKYGFIEFVVLDPTGYQVGALFDPVVGQRKLIERSDFFYRSLQGDTVVSHPFPGEIDLPDSEGVLKPNRPTMFASTPIRNNAGDTVGVLAFRVRPEVDFSHMLEVSRFGETGESYAFNDEGFLLTRSRFFDKVKELKLIPEESDTTAILNIQLRNPHKQLNGKGVSSKNKDFLLGLTQMATNAIQGKSGVNVDGYSGYRGKQVVGAWTWLPEHRFGVATEIEATEAFGSVFTITKGFLVIFSFMVVTTLAAFILRLLQMRTETERNLAQKNVKEKEIEIRALVDHAFDGIITINERGIIETFNPAAELLFGYRATDVLGQNVSLLIPEPHRSDHDSYLKKYLKTGESEIIGLAIEVQGVRQDGKLIDLELTVNGMSLRGKTKFIGILRDITKRKKAENRLQAHAKQQAALTKLGFIALQGAELPELMDHAVHLFSRTLQVDYAKILKYIPEEQAFLLKAGRGWKDGLLGKAKIPAGIESQADYTLKSDSPVVVKDLSRETRFRGPELLHEHGVVSGMSVVIGSGKRPYGVVGVHTKKLRIFTHDEINFLRSMANLLASSIERKIAEDKLQHYAAELERSNQELEDFAFIASHDLQEPLRKVMLFGDRIKSVYPSNADDRSKNYIDRLQNSIGKMQNFIHDLLEYSRVAQSSTPIKPIDLKKVISEVASNLQTQFDRTQGQIKIDPLPTIEGDEFLMAQLFQNLVSNALKYSKEDVPPRIKISSRPNGDTAWDILVEDNGMGIDPQYFNKIFKPFERLHTGDRYGGNGIGLAICSKVSTRHGGKIRIESQPGKGSTFIITLPKTQPVGSEAIPTTKLLPGLIC